MRVCVFIALFTVAAVSQANSTTRLPVTWLPLSQYARYFEEVMRFRGYQVRMTVTSSAELKISCESNSLYSISAVQNGAFVLVSGDQS